MRREPRVRDVPVALAARGAAQLACAAALLAAGLAGGWLACAAGGATLVLAAAYGLFEVLLARGLRLGERRPAGPLGAPERTEDGWVRIDQHGRALGQTGSLPAARGLYRQRSVTLTWHDPFGFWRARRVVPTDREVIVPPEVDPARLRAAARAAGGTLDLSAEPDPSGVRPYRRGDGLRQIAWRQSAHHGELMSLERAGDQRPSALVVVDTLEARDPDALAATAAALLLGLRRAPDVLLTDGLSSWRTPAQQERLLAALVADRGAAGDAESRAALVVRLAGHGAERRRVLLVTCDALGPLAATLSRGPLGRSLTVVDALPAPSAAARPREGRSEAEKDERPHAAPPAAAGTSPSCELLAALACGVLALLSLVPFLDMIRRGAWETPVAALLVAGAAAGCGFGSVLARRGARRAVRACTAVLLAAALVAAGALAAGAIFGQRHGFGLLEATSELAPAAGQGGADVLGAVRTLLATGAAQLGGQPFAEADATWDLVILMGGAALAAVCALATSTRPTRAAVCLIPLGLAAADQSVMGTTAPVWTAVVCALGLLLAWLAAPRDRRLARTGAVVLLACALGTAGTGLARLGDAPTLGLPGGTRVQTLVDLSRELRRNSGTVALTYTTNASRPLYLSAAVLEDFDGSTWRASADGGDLLSNPLGADGGATVAIATGTITTTIRTRGDTSPVPPGTESVRNADEDTYVTTGPYREPITSVEDVDELGTFAAALSSWGVATNTPSGLTAVGGETGNHLAAVVAQARAEGVVGADDQVPAIRWLVGYFTSGGFAYALDAPDGNGEDNLAVVDDFLAERRGYCTHYATAFTVLARLLGVPARVVLGYQPQGPASADGSYEVTMRQLHAWSEVWIDGAGWVGVDVTPAAGGSQPHASATTPNAPVVPEIPDVATGADAPEETTGPDEPDEGPETEAALSEGAGAPEAPAWLAPALLGLAAAGTVTAAAALALLARRRRLERGDWDYAWRRICRAACRAGVRWDRSATEQDVAEAICAQLGDGALVAAVRAAARNACLARYGGSQVPGDGRELPQTLNELVRALRRRQAPPSPRDTKRGGPPPPRWPPPPP